MTWALISTGSNVTVSSGSASLPYPAGSGSGAGAGNCVIVSCAQNAAAQGFTITGFNPLVSNTTDCSFAYFWRVLDGFEGANITCGNTAGNGGTFDASLFSGNPSAANFAASIVLTNHAQTSSQTGLSWAALALSGVGSPAGCLILGGGAKAILPSSFNTPSPWTGKLGQGVSPNPDFGYISEYVIQTTSTNISSGSWTLGGDSSAATCSVIAAILPGVSTPVPLAPMALGGMVVQVCQ